MMDINTVSQNTRSQNIFIYSKKRRLKQKNKKMKFQKYGNYGEWNPYQKEATNRKKLPVMIVSQEKKKREKKAKKKKVDTNKNL